MIDSHCHLADEAFAPDLDAVVDRARAAGLTNALCILSADELAEIERARVVSAAWSGVRFAAAVHPHRSGAYADRALDAAAAARAAVAAVQAVAVGELGLDYHYDFAPRDVQHAVFAAQIAAAVDLGLPIVVHTRDAMDDTAAILRDAGQGRVRGVIHCFTGSAADARTALDLGFHISFAGILTFPRAEDLRAVASFVPLDRLLIETDAPFLSPIPHRGKRNEPAWVVLTLARVAELKGVTLDDAARAIRENVQTLFGFGGDDATTAP